MEVQFEFMDTDNVLKQDLSKVLFDLKEANTDSESDCFDFKIFQKENIHHAMKLVYHLRNITSF